MTEHNYIVGNTYTTRAGEELTFLGVFTSLAGFSRDEVGGDDLLFARTDEFGELQGQWHYPDGSYYPGETDHRDIMPPKKTVYLNRWAEGQLFLYESREKALRLADPDDVPYTHIAFPIELPPTYGVGTKGE